MARPEWLALILIGASACSSLSFHEHYQDLPPESRRAFIARYPSYTPEQRHDIENGDSIPPLEEKENISEEIVKMEITATLVHPREYALKSVLHYKDGRIKDATADTRFGVEPNVARIEGVTLRHTCTRSDVVINGDFFGEAGGRLLLPLRDSVTALNLARDPEYDGRSEVGLYRIAATITCEDGVSSDISCLARWHSDSKAIEVTGCGRVRILDPRLVEAPPGIEIEAVYGAFSSRARFRFAPPLQKK